MRQACGRMLMIVATAAVLLLAGSDAAAQDDPFNVDDVTRQEQAEAAGGLIEKFFIATKTNVNGEQSIEWLGSLVIWFLLMLSMLSIGLIGRMALTNQRKGIVPSGVVEEVRRMMQQGQYREAMNLTGKDESYFCQVLHAALKEANHGFGAVIRALEQTSDELTTIRLRRIEYLNVLGQVSPMIGLFGTVYGMILAFQAIVVTGGNADPVMLAGGIATALITTFWGLVVAIPALAGYAIIRNKIDELTTEATLTAEAIVNQFRPKMTARAGASKTSSEPKPAVAPHPH